MDNQTRAKHAIWIIAAVFMVAAVIGAIHAMLRGYSEIYTTIFVLLAGGYGLLAYLAAPLELEKRKTNQEHDHDAQTQK